MSPLVLCTALVAMADPGAGADRYAAAGPAAVEQALVDWTDARRHRRLPAKVYFPQAAAGDVRWPLVVFSHGLGGSRQGYAYLGRHWASHGYVVVHLQHHGSDAAVWQGVDNPKESLRQAASDPANALHRLADVRFALDRLQEAAAAPAEGPLRPLAGRLDLDRIGIAGHSFGAATTLGIAGQAGIGPLGRAISAGDARVKAAIPMSPSIPRRRDALDRVYAGVNIPCLHLTGTRDDSPIVGSTAAAERRLAFDHINGPRQYLVIFEGGDHAIFSDHLRALGGRNDAHFHRLILTATTAFWDAYLKGDTAAKRWLDEGGLEAAMGAHAKVEKKPGR